MALPLAFCTVFRLGPVVAGWRCEFRLALLLPPLCLTSAAVKLTWRRALAAPRGDSPLAVAITEDSVQISSRQ